MIRHLLVTDIRRFRWILGPWVLLTVAYAALVFVTPAYVGDDSGRYDHFNVAIVLLFLVTHLAPLVLVPLVVQADAPVGSDVFWATRPIRPRALLAAKTILLMLAIVILPALLELGAMTAAHVTAGEIARIALDTILGAVVWLTLLMAASAVTPSYSKFALLCASTVVGIAINVIVMAAIIRSREEYATAALAVAPVPLPETADATGGLVFLLGVILAGCALLVVQYQRRQRIISVPVGVVGVAFAFLAATWWPWPLLRAQSTLPEWTISAPRISAASAMAPFDPPSVMMSRGGVLRMGRLALRVGGVAPGWYATVSMRSAELTLPDGAVIRSRRGGFGASPAPDDINEAPQRVALRQLLGVARLADRYPPRGENVVSMIVSADEYQRLESTTARYRGEFVVELSHAEIAGTLSLTSGSVFDGGVYQLRLLDTRPTPRGVLGLSAIETRATSTFDRRPDETYAVFALNRARSEAIEALVYEGLEIGEIAGSAGFGVHASIGVTSGFLRRGVVVTLSSQPGSNRVDIPLDAEWLKNAHLVVVRTTRVGHVVRSVEVPDMRVCTSPNGEC